MPIQIACSACKARYSIADDKAGKKVRCKCGAEIAVAATTSSAPANPQTVRSATNPKPANPKPANPKPASSKAVGPNPASIAGPASLNSMFDELTEADWNRESAIAQAFAPKKQSSDAAALKSFVVPDGKPVDPNKTPGQLIFLSVLNFIGSAVYVFAGVAIIALVEVVAQLEEVIPFIRVAAAFFCVYFIAWGFYLAALGVGLLQRSPWGWWLAGVAYAEALIDKIYYFVHSIIAQEEVPRIIGAFGGFLVMVGITSYISKRETRARFKVKTMLPVILCASIGVVVGLISVGIFTAIEMQVPAAEPPAGG